VSHPADIVAGVDEAAGDLPTVTPSHLRRGEELCRRRLKHELRGGKKRANRTGDMRFAVSNRIEKDARLAQSEPGPPRPEAFVDPRELEPEQRVLYRAGVRGYLDTFGDVSARVVDLEWGTPLEELGVELRANPGIPTELADDRRELRKIALGGRRAVIDAVDVYVALARTAEWAPEELDIVGVDLIGQLATARITAGAAEREAALAWIAPRVVRVLDLAADGRARAGADCLGCPFIAGCPAHAG